MTNHRTPIAYCNEPGCCKRKEARRLAPTEGMDAEFICLLCFKAYTWDEAKELATSTGNKYLYGEKRPRKDLSTFIMSDGKRVKGKLNANAYARKHGVRIRHEWHPM